MESVQTRHGSGRRRRAIDMFALLALWSLEMRGGQSCQTSPHQEVCCWMEPTAKTVFLRRERAASVGKRKQERSIPRQRNGSAFESFTPQSVEMRRRRADVVTSKRRPQRPVSVKVFERLQAIHPELHIHDSLHLFNINSQRKSAFTFVSFKRRKKERSVQQKNDRKETLVQQRSFHARGRLPLRYVHAATVVKLNPLEERESLIPLLHALLKPKLTSRVLLLTAGLVVNVNTHWGC